MKNFPSLNFAKTVDFVTAAVEADVVPLLIGDPGIGKTSLMRIVAGQVERELETLIGSTCDPVDIGGGLVPNAEGTAINRIPLALIRRCVESARLLFLDEVSTVPGATQATLLRVMLEKVAGDSALHQDTRVAAAANPPEQAPGGFELSAPFMGRVQVIHFRPDEREVWSFFETLGDEGSILRTEAQDFALTCQFEPGLLQIDMPKACTTGMQQWGAPRSWERAIRHRSAAIKSGLMDFDLQHSILSAGVGEEMATAYTAILKMRKQLPSINVVTEDPEHAPVPADKKQQISALGLIPRIADINTWAAWIYASRLTPEISTACARVLLTRKDSPTTAKHAKAGVQARVRLSSGLQRLA
jgi:hypothetical protein